MQIEDFIASKDKELADVINLLGQYSRENLSSVNATKCLNFLIIIYDHCKHDEQVKFYVHSEM